MNKMQFISWRDIRITGGFWKKWQDTCAQSTSRAIYDRFYETGRIDAMNLQWKEGMPNKPHVFWDSDIAKWMEGCAYFLFHREDSEILNKLEDIIDRILRGQTEDGYFNSAILTLEPEKRFTDRTNHELYTAGHLIEAAVAHYEATQSPRFLERMERFADCIGRIFKEEHSAQFKTPGHQELELALIRLYRATGKDKYLKLSGYFVDTRGTDLSERVFSVPNGTYPAAPPLANQLTYDDTYAQDGAPARELEQAGGHAVRAMYYYSAMADLALEYGDKELLNACRRLWEDCVNRKMYVTGGVSAERYGEAIGTDYVLPSDLSYAETCASVAMANFSMRMFYLEQDGRYADMIERQMYNGALVGLSMDGTSFYYDNALQCRTEVTDFFERINARPLYPAYQRLRVFDCSCCPPNVFRFIGALGQYFYSCADDVLFVHQYAEGSACVHFNGQRVTLHQETCYPWNGDIMLTIGLEKNLNASVAVRIPGWSCNAVLFVNGKVLETESKNGYVYIRRTWQDGDRIEMRIPMPVVLLEGHPKILETSGRAAIRRGPLIYCVEGTDNRGTDLFDLTLGKDTHFSEEYMELAGHRILVLTSTGLVSDLKGWDDKLYCPVSAQKKYVNVNFKAIPYFAWSNRGANDMAVWIKYR